MATIFARYCSCCDKKPKASEGEFQFKNRTNSKGTPSTYENDVNKAQTPHKKTYSFIFNQQVSPVTIQPQLIQNNNNTRNLSQDNTNVNVNVSRLFHKQSTINNNNNNVSAVSQGSNNNNNSNQSNISRYSYSNSVSNVMVSISSSNINSSNYTHSRVSHVDHNGDNYFNSVESSSSSSSSNSRNTRKAISSLTKPRTTTTTTAIGAKKVKAITPEELIYIPKIQLKGKGDDDIFYGRILYINAAGVHNSLRQKHDGITYFGISTAPALTNYTNREVDVLLNLNLRNANTSSSTANTNNNTHNNVDKTTSNDLSSKWRRVFAIGFNKDKSNYFLYNVYKQSQDAFDTTNNTAQKQFQLLMYVKISFEYPIENVYSNLTTNYFLLGRLLMVIFIRSGKYFYNKSEIIVKVLNEQKQGVITEKTFTTKDSPITIGRENCSITIDNKNISRTHSTLFYNKFNNKWYIVDGNGKDKMSTHGTWLIVDHKTKFQLLNIEERYEVKICDKYFYIEMNVKEE